jgi:hypothetical protein
MVDVFAWVSKIPCRISCPAGGRGYGAFRGIRWGPIRHVDKGNSSLPSLSLYFAFSRGYGRRFPVCAPQGGRFVCSLSKGLPGIGASSASHWGWWAASPYIARMRRASMNEWVKCRQSIPVDGSWVAWRWMMRVGDIENFSFLDYVGMRRFCKWGAIVQPGVGLHRLRRVSHMLSNATLIRFWCRRRLDPFVPCDGGGAAVALAICPPACMPERGRPRHRRSEAVHSPDWVKSARGRGDCPTADESRKADSDQGLDYYRAMEQWSTPERNPA